MANHTIEQALTLLDMLGRVEGQLRMVRDFGAALNNYAVVLGLPANFARLTGIEMAGIEAVLARLEANEAKIRAKITDLSE